MKTKAMDLDEELAGIDPGKLPNSMLIGVAPVMDGDTRKTYWGAEPEEGWSRELKKAFGCGQKQPNSIVKHIIERIEPGISARMVMQSLISSPEKGKAEEGPRSKKVPREGKRDDAAPAAAIAEAEEEDTKSKELQLGGDQWLSASSPSSEILPGSLSMGSAPLRLSSSSPKSLRGP